MGNNKAILLVEDNPDDEALTLRALKKNNITNQLIVARDGAEALDWLFGAGQHADRDSSVPPQAILLDLKLPKIDGLQVLQQIRAHPRTRLLPVIILTSSDEEADIAESYQQGANSYIRKPVEFGKFVQAVQNLGLYWLILNEAPPAPRN
ncbi:response regulator [Nitrosococcus watsonii]|uniref:Response regulator receiver protein n=1 Tax=Nitrosococcus watsoni (strain C-113) TaxID=105559 RepID=D8K5V0_NITWC|nr:response regulator [Nitrosococcus watsonii]ADJ28277.1 response regulator receiver protein [Nitrosococcus watsonii C-113]